MLKRFSSIFVTLMLNLLVPAAAQVDSEISLDFRFAGDRVVEYTIVGQPNRIETVTDEIARCLANMPPQHHQYIVPIYIVPALPGGRPTGSGYYPKNPDNPYGMHIWLGRSARTGVPDGLVQEHIAREDVPGIVAITHARINDPNARIYHLSALHETAHSIQNGGLSLTPPGTRVEALAQTYARAPNNLEEHAAEAYSRWIGQPARVCRQDKLPAGESMGACTRRVTQTLRRSAAFQTVPADWSPLGLCRTNDLLSPSRGLSPAPVDPGPQVSEQGGNVSEEVLVDTSGARTIEPVDGTHAGDSPPAIATYEGAVPVGKGIFIQRINAPRAQNGLESVFGTPFAFVSQLQSADISWVALPTNQRLWHDRVMPYIDALHDNGLQVFAWRGGPESRDQIPQQVAQLIEGAVRFRASGVILDPELCFNRVGNHDPRLYCEDLNRDHAQGGDFVHLRGDRESVRRFRETNLEAARELYQETRRRAAEHGLSVGVSSLQNYNIHIEPFAGADFALPQIYDRFDNLPADWPSNSVARWARTFDTVIPILGTYHRSTAAEMTASGATRRTRPKTREEFQQLILETPITDNAVAFWRYSLSFKSRDYFATEIANMSLGQGAAPGNGADPGAPEDESDRPHHYPDEDLSASDNQDISVDAAREGRDGSRQLTLIGRDDVWYVFNQEISRAQAIGYFWGSAFTPNANELRAREGELRTPDGHVFELPSTHWRVVEQAGFTRRAAQTQLRPEIRDQIATLPDVTDHERLRENARPRWIPSDVWSDMLEKFDQGSDRVEVYSGRSPVNTDIIIAFRNGAMGGYADQIERQDQLRGLYGVLEPTLIEEITGQTSEQAFIRWLAQANADYNQQMRHYVVNDGMTVRAARERYAYYARTRLAIEILRAYRRGLGTPVSRELDTAIKSLRLLWGLVSD